MRLSHLFLALIVVAIWGFNFVVIKIGLDGLPPLFLGAIRFFLTSIPFIFFIKLPKVPFKKVVGYGITTFVLQFSFLFVGMSIGVTPGIASLLLQVHVLFTILLGAFLMREKLHIWNTIGMLISFSGIILVGMHLGSAITLPGFLLVIASALAWAAGNLICKHLGRINMLSLVVWGSFIAWPPLLILSLAIEGPPAILQSLQTISPISILAVLYITYASTMFGFGVWSYLVHHHPLKTIVPFTLLVPVFGILGSMLVIDEPLQMWKFIAFLLVIAGLAVNIVRSQFLPRDS